MRTTLRSVLRASLLTLAGLTWMGATTAQAQVTPNARPAPPVSPGYSSPGRVYYNSALRPPSNTYVRPAARRAAPNPRSGGHRNHYGYFPARRDLPLYKPWLSKD